jgi:hypothetical protein
VIEVHFQDKMRIQGLKSYLNSLVKGLKLRRTVVHIRYQKKEDGKIMGCMVPCEYGIHIIDIYVPEDHRYPCKMPDDYVKTFESLHHWRKYPRIVNNVQEYIAYIFLHEVHHIMQWRAKVAAHKEDDASAWANIKWLPY